jgi:3-oxosteroid 1-dehydrogenase
MCMNWDAEFDFIAIGSGAAGMSAAIRAHDQGASVVILEASPKYGGSTAISGGVVWIPNNPQLPSRGIQDSREAALDYLKHLTAGRVSTQRLEAYVDESLRIYDYYMEHTHVRLDALEAYSDYYPEVPGGMRGGRSMEPVPISGARLGEHFKQLRRPHNQSQVMGKFGITVREAHKLLKNTMVSRMLILWRFFLWTINFWQRAKYGRDTRLTAGNALIARLRLSLLDRDIPLWLSCPATALIIEDGRVVGVIAERDGKTIRIRASEGVLLAAGGFEHNQAMRDKYQRKPIKTEWNAGNTYNIGRGIEMGIEAGGAIDLMEDAWWTPVTRVPREEAAWVLVVEKNLPGGIMVNKHAARFTNEAAPYLDVVHAMYDNDAVPVCWLVFDAEYRKNYPVGPVAPGYAQPDIALSKRLKHGFLNIAPTLAELAEKIDLGPAALVETVERYNGMAATGEDTDFGRGESLADRYYGDSRVTPNPCVRPLGAGPYYAIGVFPGDLGTKGGLMTDARARVLDADDVPIPGLYAAGNCSSAVMGPTYPGAGGTIGPALVFGFIAAETAKMDAASAKVDAASATVTSKEDVHA